MKRRSVATDGNLSGLDSMFQTPTKSPRRSSTLYSEVPPTPEGPGMMLVSPMSSVKGSAKRTGQKSTQKSPKTPNMRGVRELLKTPKNASSPKLGGIRHLMRSPRALPGSPDLSGVQSLLAGSPIQRTPKSVKKATPKKVATKVKQASKPSPKTPKLGGIRHLMRSPRAPLGSPDLVGVQSLLAGSPIEKTPKSVKKATPKKSATPKRNASPKAVTPRSVAKALTPKAITPKAAVAKDVTPKTAKPKAASPKKVISSPKVIGRRGRRAKAAVQSPVKVSIVIYGTSIHSLSCIFFYFSFPCF